MALRKRFRSRVAFVSFVASFVSACDAARIQAGGWLSAHSAQSSLNEDVTPNKITKEEDVPDNWKPKSYNCPYDLASKMNWYWYFFQEHDYNIQASLRLMGLDVVKEINTCCRHATLLPETTCDHYTCEEFLQGPRRTLYKAMNEDCAPEKTHNENTHNKVPINLFKVDCPRMPVCAEEVPKTGLFKQESARPKQDGIELGESADFLVAGKLASISYELDRSLPWYEGDGAERGHTCKFGLQGKDDTEFRQLGAFKSGEAIVAKFGRDVKVKKGDRLFWWGCDIKMSGSSSSSTGAKGGKGTYQEKVKHMLAGNSSGFAEEEMGFPSLVARLEYVDFRPNVWTAYTPFNNQPGLDKMHQLLSVQWYSFGGKIQLKRERWDPTKSRHSLDQDDGRWVVEMDENFEDSKNYTNRVVHKLESAQYYRLTFRNTAEAAAKGTMLPVTYVYLRTTSIGCRNGYKCCVTEENGKLTKSQCIAKEGWLSGGFGGRTCGSEPGRRGAKDANGQHTDKICQYCDDTLAAPEDVVKVYKRYDKDPSACVPVTHMP